MAQLSAEQLEQMKARRLVNHEVNDCNRALLVEAVGSPGPGGAPTIYGIWWAGREGLPPAFENEPPGFEVRFHTGPMDRGVNGITNEVLLAILEDRIASFQSGEFACDENAKALEAVRQAQQWLQIRTQRRIAQGVEGTHEKDEQPAA